VSSFLFCSLILFSWTGPHFYASTTSKSLSPRFLLDRVDTTEVDLLGIFVAHGQTPIKRRNNTFFVHRLQQFYYSQRRLFWQRPRAERSTASCCTCFLTDRHNFLISIPSCRYGRPSTIHPEIWLRNADCTREFSGLLPAHS